MPTFYDFFGGNLGDPPSGLPSSRVGIAETFPRGLVGGSAAPTTANWNASLIWLPSGLKISGITFFSGSAALSVGVHQWFGLWNSSLALLGGSADDTSTAWAANTAKRLALTTPFTTVYAGNYYVGIEITATTVPTLAMTGSANVSGATRGLTPAATILDTTTADTALAPTLTQAATTTASFGRMYAVLD